MNARFICLETIMGNLLLPQGLFESPTLIFPSEEIYRIMVVFKRRSTAPRKSLLTQALHIVLTYGVWELWYDLIH
jgi:hypothetical protein